MRREVIYTGSNDKLIALLNEKGVRTTLISNIASFKTSKRSVFILFADEKCTDLLPDCSNHQLAWAKSKGIPPLYVSSHLDMKRTRALYQLGFDRVFKEDDHMKGLLDFLIPPKKVVPGHLLGGSNIYNDEVTKLFNLLSRSSAPVLIRGESGVGKTHLVEKIVKELYPSKKFIAKNLSEYSAHLLESELFGHTKGAFTGAVENRKGLFEKADGGFLFLDEIATLPLLTQQKILKVIEEKCVTPVGSNKSIELNFQLITATCEDLGLAMKEKRFREDLYYRLSLSCVHIPSIAQRAEEIELILYHLQEASDHKISFSDESIELLKQRQWKGNYRELQSLLLELSLKEISYVTPKNLPKVRDNQSEDGEDLLTQKQRQIIKSAGLPELIKKIELESFQATAKHLKGRTNQICEVLKISKSVYYRIQQSIETSVDAS